MKISPILGFICSGMLLGPNGFGAISGIHTTETLAELGIVFFLFELYIMTLAVLAPYRGRKIGSQLIQSMLDYCLTNSNISQIALHVQISNHDAIRFYCNLFGFIQGDIVENYYKRINPPHCYLLYKDMIDLRPSPQQQQHRDRTESLTTTTDQTE
jgi:ribosomal protein S18 acetylase RimI-like enzyme